MVSSKLSDNEKHAWNIKQLKLSKLVQKTHCLPVENHLKSSHTEVSKLSIAKNLVFWSQLEHIHLAERQEQLKRKNLQAKVFQYQ